MPVSILIKYDLMKKYLPVLLALLFAGSLGAVNTNPETCTISVIWNNQKPAGTIEILNGSLKSVKITSGKGQIKNNRFTFSTANENRLELEILNPVLKAGRIS